MSQHFVVSARKYRPTRFDEVVGQENTTIALKNAIKSNHIAHAFLFCGPRGVGKTTIARILAKTINCKDLQPDGEACNYCDSCQTFNANSSFNIYELDAASKNGVDDIKMLIEQTTYPPQNATFKIFIIDEVHMLSDQAFNAFLKTLEEPPSYCKFIMATTEKHKILPTILSRCQIYDFKRISVLDIQNHLIGIAEKEGVEAELKALNLIAQKSDGGLRDALSLFDRLTSLGSNKLNYESIVQNLNILDHDFFFEIIDYIYQQESAKILLAIDSVLQKGFELDTFLEGLSEHIRNLWVALNPDTIKLLEYSLDINQRYLNQAKYFKESTYLNMLQVLSDAEVKIKYSKNKRIIVELALLKLIYLEKITNTSWTSLEVEKKNEPTLNEGALKTRQKETSPNSATNSILPKQRFNSLEDLAIKSEKENNKPKIEVLELAPITQFDIWPKIVAKIPNNNLDKDTLSVSKPSIQNDTFIFKVANTLQQQMYESNFTLLSNIYQSLTGTRANFECIVDESLSNQKVEGVALSKAEKFEELAEKYELLLVLKSEMGLDLYI